jgi:hypothetical protein
MERCSGRGNRAVCRLRRQRQNSGKRLRTARRVYVPAMRNKGAS